MSVNNSRTVYLNLAGNYIADNSGFSKDLYAFVSFNIAFDDSTNDYRFCSKVSADSGIFAYNYISISFEAAVNIAVNADKAVNLHISGNSRALSDYCVD